MKLVFSLLVLIFNLSTDCTNLEKVRDQFHTIKTKEDLKKFIANTKETSCSRATPYIASCTMKKAEYTIWPFKKLAYFNEGKKSLEDYIKQHPKDIEAKYVRLLVQTNIPDFLGYNTRIAADKKFINENIAAADLPENYKKTILQNINNISPN
ncbi:hypothetical protein M4I21_14230 [Cellulophaga sp. 20_2_10]|uniref:hypothetical protein n=1 Tax=Cellulophaga sp. 20_2_10 TaxID=2942476 RepID=UPI00201A365D|nr:hypothetical protein [Cellulophaga sp. 20_2_10]MCL5246975.1 hypothetical protein [Cellulophaga sp. 20_2_10]